MTKGEIYEALDESVWSLRDLLRTAAERFKADHKEWQDPADEYSDEEQNLMKAKELIQQAMTYLEG